MKPLKQAALKILLEQDRDDELRALIGDDEEPYNEVEDLKIELQSIKVSKAAAEEYRDKIVSFLSVLKDVYVEKNLYEIHDALPEDDEFIEYYVDHMTNAVEEQLKEAVEEIIDEFKTEMSENIDSIQEDINDTESRIKDLQSELQ